MTIVDPNQQLISPLEGTGMAIFVVAIVCGGLSLLFISLRTYIRLSEQAFDWDDGLMLCGIIVFIVEIVLACLGAQSGLGALNSRLNSYLQMQSRMYLITWMMLYVVSLFLIKCSLCATMLRIGRPIKFMRIAVYILLAFAVGTFFATLIGILLLCNPVSANWDTSLVLEGKAKCVSMNVMIGLSYFPTASSIATDMACAVLPGFLVRNMHLKMRTKISVCILLSFGSLACISTIIRTPYIRSYRSPTDDLVYHVGNIVLWSNIETAIGLAAGSITSLRRLIVRHNEKQNSGFGSMALESKGKALGLPTFGSTPGSAERSNRAFKNPTDLGISVSTVTVHTRHERDWRRLQDHEMCVMNKSSCEMHNKKNIRADYTYEVELTSPEHRSTRSVDNSSRESMIKESHETA